jgi:hypothetical protein
VIEIENERRLFLGPDCCWLLGGSVARLQETSTALKEHFRKPAEGRRGRPLPTLEEEMGRALSATVRPGDAPPPSPGPQHPMHADPRSPANLAGAVGLGATGPVAVPPVPMTTAAGPVAAAPRSKDLVIDVDPVSEQSLRHWALQAHETQHQTGNAVRLQQTAQLRASNPTPGPIAGAGTTAMRAHGSGEAAAGPSTIVTGASKRQALILPGATL